LVFSSPCPKTDAQRRTSIFTKQRERWNFLEGFIGIRVT